MRLRNYGVPVFALLTFLTVLAVSCTDDLNKHYSAEQTTKSNLNLYQYIQAQTELSTFTKMLKIAGYDTILKSSQTFTVWAPTDHSLENVNLLDTAQIIKIVENHIARFSYPTTAIVSKKMIMLDNKLIVFANGSEGYTFGGLKIVQSDVATKNGIIHVLSDYLPYRMSIWEFLNNAEGIDSVRNYINSFSITSIDTAASYKNGFMIKKVYKTTNILLKYFAEINKEDSIYTVIWPNNTAWVEAYNRILPYYNTLNKDGGVATQIANTKLTIIKDLFFRGVKSLPISTDSLFSTNRNGFADPNRLFVGAQVTELSNGLSYVTDKLKYNATESWCPKIKVEAESGFYRTDTLFTPTIQSSIGTGFKISNYNYLNLTPIGTGSNQSTTFQIPYTLSAKYDIYCAFVPGSIINPLNVKPYKVKFYLSYVDSNGKQVINAPVDKNNAVMAKGQIGDVFTTTPTSQVQEMLVVSGFQFPYTNLYKTTGYAPTVKLKVENVVVTSEAAKFSKTLRIDYIILKPVQ
ncbi:MAG: fasciclin domain-containing protein [Paludibacter sp.]|nr:fasciclin domain-containing protein [Paludibacter sp.]